MGDYLSDFWDNLKVVAGGGKLVVTGGGSPDAKWLPDDGGVTGGIAGGIDVPGKKRIGTYVEAENSGNLIVWLVLGFSGYMIYKHYRKGR